MIIKLHTSQNVTVGLHGGREWEPKRKKSTRGREAGKDEKAGGREKERRQKDEDESVGEKMGIKRETGQDNCGQSGI